MSLPFSDALKAAAPISASDTELSTLDRSIFACLSFLVALSRRLTFVNYLHFRRPTKMVTQRADLSCALEGILQGGDNYILCVRIQIGVHWQ